MLDVRATLANALKGVEVNKGASYQSDPGRRFPDKVVRVDYNQPKVVHHIRKFGDYRYTL